MYGVSFAGHNISVPYRGATFLNIAEKLVEKETLTGFPSPIGELHFSITSSNTAQTGEKISVPYRGATFLNSYHPRNPMSCLGRIGGLRGKSNFIEIQPFWKVKSSHKSSI